MRSSHRGSVRASALALIQDDDRDAIAGRQRCVRRHVPLTCGFATPLPAPSLCSRPRCPARRCLGRAPCRLVARVEPRRAHNRGHVFIGLDPKRLGRFGHYGTSCLPRRARIPTQRLVFDLAPPRSRSSEPKKPTHVPRVHRCTVLYESAYELQSQFTTGA